MNRFEFNSNLIDFKNKQDELAHYGTRGQKWGVRKWQNYDGTFNEAGKERYFGSKKNETFGSKKTPEEKEQIRQEKFDKKVNYWVNRQKKQIERYNKNPFHKNKQINIDDDTLKGYYESLWSLPWYKRTHKNAVEEYKKKNGITMTDEDIKNLKKMHDVDSQNRMNQINRLNEQMRQAEELNRMSQLDQLNQLNQLDQQTQEINRINQINQMNQLNQIHQIEQMNQLNQLQQIEQMNQINQLNQLNTMNQINMMNQMMMPGFMGKPEKFGTARNPKMNLKVDPELLKEYSEDEIEDSIQSVVNDIRSKAPEGPEYDPSSYDVTVDKDGSFHIDFHYDDNNSDNQYSKDKAKTEKYLDENYDKDFAQVMKDTYDTTGEWGDIDAAYEQFKENPYEYLKKYSRDPKYNLSPKEEKKAAKEAKRLNNEFDDCIGYKEEDDLIDHLRYDSEYSDLINDMINNDREKYAKEYKRTKEIFDGFENDRHEMYAKAGITNALLYLKDDTMDTISNMARHYTYDDGDQGWSNSSSLYAKYEKGADYGELSDLYEKLNNNEQKTKDNINFLKKDPVLSKVNEKYLEKIVNGTTRGSLNSRLYNATEDSNGINDDERNAYAESKKIAKKLEPSCGARGSGWYYLNQAINNLGMGNISYKDLTDADWNRINAEVNKLKK